MKSNIIRNMKTIFKMRKSFPISLQNKELSPYFQDEFEWVEVWDYNIYDEYYYCIVMANGRHIPLPLVQDIKNNIFLKNFIPSKWWDKFEEIMSKYRK